MNSVVEWLSSRAYYEGQITATRTVPGREPALVDVDLEPRLASVLAERGIEQLYRHQAEAIEAVRGGKNVVLATPTASGKSLAYTVPAFERAMDRGARTLYLAPTNALINDQTETLDGLARGLGFGSRVSVDYYTGQLDDTERRAVRDRQPTVVLTNPDMLHYALLPYARRLWEWLFSGLELVVVDEVHEYRGVFGSHVALLFRRLARICAQFDADPQFICCSATISNPVEHASAVTGRQASSFRLVDEDTSVTAPTHWVLWNPPEYADGSGQRRSNHIETMRLLGDLVVRGHQTVAFTRARQAAERYATETANYLRERGHRELADSIAAYQAALDDDRRRDLETALHDGDLQGVWSTNALELGVDVGGLDVVLLDGYPGTRMAARQQAGRAGRGDDPSLVGLIAGSDQLDQYLMRNPADFFEKPPERATVDPENEQLLPDHVRSAARENWLSPDDDRFFGDSFPEVVAELSEQGELERRETDSGIRWTYDGGGSPQHEMGLRTISDREITLFDRRRRERLGTLGFADALRDAHPGAIYHHQGRTYEVVDLDLGRDKAELDTVSADYYTRVLHDKDITVETDLEERRLPNEESVLRFAEVTMRKQITGFERRNARTDDFHGRTSLSLPETTLETKGLYFTIPPAVEDEIRDGDGSFEGGIHAAEHALISLFPLELLCDRRDIGGLSTPLHPRTDQSTIFIYDGYPGGVGLTQGGYHRLESLMASARTLIDSCDCESGCPSCIQSPHCGNANSPLDKEVAVQVLDALSSAE